MSGEKILRSDMVSLRYRIEEAIEAWRDELDDPPACLYDPDFVKVTAREARDVVERRIKERHP
jgi:hypothetical protein